MKHIFSIALFTAVIFSMGCGDGVNRSRPQFGIAALNPQIVAPLLECVDVTDYKHITVSESEDREVLPISGGTVEQSLGAGTTQIGSGRRLPPGMGSVDAMKKLATKAALGGKTVAAEEIQDCIEEALRAFKKCGRSCGTYWGSATWLLSRERFQKRPKSSEVRILSFTGCEQVDKARCLLTD